MNFKLSALVAAALLASGSAHAITATNDVSGGNAYLLLTVLDTSYNNGVGRSYTRSLEVAMNDFGTQNRASGGFTTNVDTMPVALTSNAGSLWSTFTAGMTPSQIAALQWDVTALDATGTSAADQRRIITTANTNVVSLVAASGTAFNNGAITSATNNQDGYWDAVIGAMGSGTEIIIDDAASSAFAIGVNQHGSNLGGQLTAFGTMNNVGSSSGLYYLTRTGSSSSAEALAVAYGNGANATTAMLGANGQLVISTVPEASTYGMMLAGLGLVGFMAGRRRRV